MNVEKKDPSCTVMGMQTGVAIGENSMRFLRKLKIELPYNPVFTLLHIYPQNMKTLTQRNTWIPMFI